MPSRRRIIYLILFILVWLLPVFAFLRPDEPESSQLTYTLDWEWGAAQATETGWRTVTNLGYDVTITEGYIVAYETQLTACEHSHDNNWFSWLAIPEVSAGHGDDGNDSTWSNSNVEDLANPQSQQWGTVTLYEPTYCEAFFLVARAASDTTNQPDELDMFGTSIYLSGIYTAPDSDDAIPFTLETRHANGTVQPFLLEGQTVHLGLSRQPMEIAITRSLATLFDDINFIDDAPDDAAFQVLRNLLDDTQFHVIEGKTHIE